MSYPAKVICILSLINSYLFLLQQASVAFSLGKFFSKLSVTVIVAVLTICDLATLGNAIHIRISYICVTLAKVVKASKTIITVAGIFINKLHK